MQRFKLIIIALIFALLTGCSFDTISSSNLNDINIGYYFSTDQAKRLIYKSYNDNGEVYAATERTVLDNEDDVDGYLYKILEETKLYFDEVMTSKKYITYKVTQNHIIEVNLESIGVLNTSKETNEIILINKPEWKKEEGLITVKVQGINETVTTPAGTFTDCIEVIEQAKLSTGIAYQKKYYAPRIGLVQTQIKGEKGEYYVSQELVNITSSTMSFNENNINTWIVDYFRRYGFEDEPLDDNMFLAMYSASTGFHLGFHGTDLENVLLVEGFFSLVNIYNNNYNISFLQHLFIGISNNDRDFVEPANGWFIDNLLRYGESKNKQQLIESITIKDKKILLSIEDDIVSMFISLGSELPEDKSNLDKYNENNMNNIDSDFSNDANKLNYINPTYGFSIDIPYSWENAYVIETRKWSSEMEDSINFNFISNDIIYSNIFSIIILDGEIEESKWDHPFWKYILHNDGKTFVYSTPGELPLELLDDEKKDELETLVHMVNEDVPKIIDSFKLTN